MPCSVVIKTIYKVLRRPPLLRVYAAVGTMTCAQELLRSYSKKHMVPTKTTRRVRGKHYFMVDTYLLTKQSKK